MLAAIPVIGGLLVEVFFEHRSRLKQRRLEDFLEGLGGEIARLSEGEAFRSKLEDEHFADLLESAAARAVRTGDESKHERLRRVVLKELRSATGVNHHELYLDLITELSEKHVEVLTAFRDAHIIAQARGGDDRNLPLQGPFRSAEHYAIDQASFDVLLLHLVSRGLFYDDGVGRWSTGALEVFDISAMGLDFLKHLEAPPGSSKPLPTGRRDAG